MCKVYLLYRLFISMTCTLQYQGSLVSYCWVIYFMNECSKDRLFVHVYNFSTFLWPIPYRIKYSKLVIRKQQTSWIWTPAVNYLRQDCSIATEKLAFEYNIAMTNLCQQNSCMTNGIIFVTTYYCTIFSLLLYQKFLTVCAYP